MLYVMHAGNVSDLALAACHRVLCVSEHGGSERRGEGCLKVGAFQSHS